MRAWTTLALAVLVVIPFTMASACAADPEETTDQKVKRLDRELAQLRKDLEELRGDVRSNSLRRYAVAERRNADLEDLRKRLFLLEQMVLRHDDLLKTPPVTRQSGAGPGPEVPGAGNGGMASPATATVTLRNRYTATATITLNGHPITVRPNETLAVAVPVGSLTYEVYVEGYGRIQPSTVNLSPRGRTINVFPIEP